MPCGHAVACRGPEYGDKSVGVRFTLSGVMVYHGLIAMDNIKWTIDNGQLTMLSEEE
jgi:hypothetical protein